MMLPQGNSATRGAFYVATLNPKEISGRTITPNKIDRPAEPARQDQEKAFPHGNGFSATGTEKFDGLKLVVGGLGLGG